MFFGIVFIPYVWLVMGNISQGKIVLWDERGSVWVELLTHCAEMDLKGTVSLRPSNAGFSMVHSCLSLSQYTTLQAENWGNRYTLDPRRI